MTLLPALDGPTDHPDAVRVGDAALSWAELRGAAAAVADDIGGARVVAVDAQPTLETVVGVLGGLLAGVPAVPVPPDAGPRERDHLLRDSGAELLLSSRGFDGVTTVPVALECRSATAWPEPAGDATALILYTSGTTGAPKGVLLSRDAIAADLDALADAWAWTPEDTLAHGLPLYHVHGLVLGVLGALRVGSRLVHTVRPTADAYAAAGGSLYFGVPTVWSRVCAAPAAARALSAARLLVSGSAALPSRVYAELQHLTGHRPVERYGMTETLITLATRADRDRRPGTVGVPVAGVSARVVADAPDDAAPASVARPGAIGELQVRGPTLFSGYLGRPEATAACYTADGWFRTGDVAVREADGTHRIVGRASTDLIKSGGFRIGAGEVEDALLSHPGVSEAAVVGVPHNDLGQEIVAYVVASGVTADALIDHVATTLSVHKRPRRVVLLDSLPRNAMGKVQKQQLASPP
ncbi:MAG: AMP-binding protein [Micromonosporaceae bacterium]